MILLSNFNYNNFERERRASCKVEGAVFRSKLCFTGKSSIRSTTSQQTGNWALLSLLYPAMFIGEDLHVDTSVSNTLLFNTNNDLQALLIAYEPRLKRIKVTASELVEESEYSSDLVATGFSAGVDTFTTLSMYFSGEKIPRSRRISSLTVFNVGAMGPYEKSAELFQLYSKRVKRFATENNLEWQTIDSNLDDFYAQLKIKFQKTHVIRNIAAALLLFFYVPIQGLEYRQR